MSEEDDWRAWPEFRELARALTIQRQAEGRVDRAVDAILALQRHGDRNRVALMLGIDRNTLRIRLRARGSRQQKNP